MFSYARPVATIVVASVVLGLVVASALLIPYRAVSNAGGSWVAPANASSDAPDGAAGALARMGRER